MEMHIGRRDFITFLGGAATAFPITWLAARALQNDRIRALQVRALRLQAENAASMIEQFVKGIEAQLGWTVQVPWDAATFQQRRIDAWRLLRQMSAISEFEQIDPSGLVQLHVSRTEPDEVESRIDVSQHPKFRHPLMHTTYYGPVYFGHNSEPHTTLALAGARDAGVSVAEVKLTFMGDVMSMIKVGKHGLAYVVDAEGRLIAHPDIGMVLRNTDLSGLPQVQAARAAPTQPVQVVKDINGRELLVAYAKVEPTGWLLFVEIPLDEASALAE
jgi:two-component system, NtrC family, sensor kinase